MGREEYEGDAMRVKPARSPDSLLVTPTTDFRLHQLAHPFEFVIAHSAKLFLKREVFVITLPDFVFKSNNSPGSWRR